MIAGPILVTERLILRPPGPEDLDGWATMAAEPETMRHIGGTLSRAGAWRQLCTSAGAWHIRGFSMFSVIERDSGEWVGRIGPWQPEGWPGREVGWGVRERFAGRGYALEAATAVIDYAFDLLGWDRVIHVIAPDNHRSIALAKRLGSGNLGRVLLPNPLSHLTVDAWGQDAAAWRARRGSVPPRHSPDPGRR